MDIPKNALCPQENHTFEGGSPVFSGPKCTFLRSPFLVVSAPPLLHQERGHSGLPFTGPWRHSSIPWGKVHILNWLYLQCIGSSLFPREWCTFRSMTFSFFFFFFEPHTIAQHLFSVIVAHCRMMCCTALQCQAKGHTLRAGHRADTPQTW